MVYNCEHTECLQEEKKMDICLDCLEHYSSRNIRCIAEKNCWFILLKCVSSWQSFVIFLIRFFFFFFLTYICLVWRACGWAESLIIDSYECVDQEERVSNQLQINIWLVCTTVRCKLNVPICFKLASNCGILFPFMYISLQRDFSVYFVFITYPEAKW